MRQILFTLTLSLLISGGLLPVIGQSAECTSDEIEDQIDTFYATYLTDRDGDTTEAAQALADSITGLINNCESDLDDENSSHSDTIVTPGRWYVNWSVDGSTCSDGTTSTATDRPFLLTLSDEGFTATDNYAWPPLEFMPTEDETIYSFNRNDPEGDFTYRYDVTLLSSDDMTGTITLFFSNGCTLASDFVMNLQDADTICMVNSDTRANLRSGPGIDFSPVGQLASIILQTVVGQAIGTDGFIWWQLEDESWVRSDIVEEIGNCENIDEVEP